MRKAIILFFSVFTISFIISCICECDPPNTYVTRYNSVNIFSVDTLGYKANIIDTITTNFYLRFGLNEEKTQVATDGSNYISCKPNFFLPIAMATSCDCPIDNYTILDTIDSAQVFMTDLNSGIKKNVTENFKYLSQNNLWYDLNGFTNFNKSYGSYYYQYYDNHYLRMIETDSLPDDSAQFSIKIFLKNKLMLTNKTEKIIIKK